MRLWIGRSCDEIRKRRVRDPGQLCGDISEGAIQVASPLSGSDIQTSDDHFVRDNRHDRSGDSEIVLDILYYLCSIKLVAIANPNRAIKDEQNRQKPDFV